MIVGQKTRRIVFALMAGASALGLAGCQTTGSSRDSVTITVPDRTSVTMAYAGAEPAGTILVSYGHRQLYLVEGNGQVRAYTVAVPRPGEEGPFPVSSGGYRYTTITHERANPSWTPTPSMLRENPELRAYAGGEPGNPMGSYALYLRDRSVYRIHGSANEISIGGAVSSGCIRMTNEQVEDLGRRVEPGAVVKFYDGAIPGIGASGPRMVTRDIPVVDSVRVDPAALRQRLGL